ncbi:hypothetical protein Vadar_007191 [Vaccinium darrowii]|uniref:Uncharacterized protein n=1 Tax=Vaccinium darrowii TaxID=229202 RepID=A0ACB7YK90_9ERIC|nr:hypothetical protein Vadar_007191 [Vaccinium darrowii]
MDIAELIKQKKKNVVEDERKRLKEFLALFAEKRRRSGRVGNLLSVKEEEEIIIIENDEIKDCFILDSDPNDSLIIDLSKLSISSDLDATDISVLAEKGQVACRDYPHSRHLCLKNPFGKTPHESYCELDLQVSGLQVLKDGKWMAIKPHPNAFVINIGGQ